MLWIMYKIDPSGAFTEVGCIMIDALFYCMLVVCGILSYYQGKKEKERMKKAKFKILKMKATAYVHKSIPLRMKLNRCNCNPAIGMSITIPFEQAMAFSRCLSACTLTNANAARLCLRCRIV